MLAGFYHTLTAHHAVDFGWYLSTPEGEEILLPKRFAPEGLKAGDPIKVFIYHDGEGRIIATTQQPLGIVGEIVSLKVTDTNAQGAFLDWGLMKDLFLPLSEQSQRATTGSEVLVMIYRDEQTGRAAATEKIARYFSNEAIKLQPLEMVRLVIWQQTDIGFKVIINNAHTGVLHFSDIFQTIYIGDAHDGYIKRVYENGNLDVVLGMPGMPRAQTAQEKILEKLQAAGGFLPFNDKSEPEAIYEAFGISKKTFKMAIGMLYKEQKIAIVTAGIQRMENGS